MLFYALNTEKELPVSMDPFDLRWIRKSGLKDGRLIGLVLGSLSGRGQIVRVLSFRVVKVKGINVLVCWFIIHSDTFFLRHNFSGRIGEISNRWTSRCNIRSYLTSFTSLSFLGVLC